MARPESEKSALRRLTMVGSKTFAVTIPIEIIRQLGLKKGDELVVRRVGSKIIIEKR